MSELYTYPPVTGTKEEALLRRALYLLEAYTYDDDCRELVIDIKERLGEIESNTE